MPVHMELKRIVINEVHDQQVVMLREVDGERSFPIVIGIFEATSIDRRMKGIQSPRPLTHDLLASVIDHLGGDLQDIFISELSEHTYFAKLRIRKDGEIIEVDCRPSDAIALAVTAKARFTLPRMSSKKRPAKRNPFALSTRTDAQSVFAGLGETGQSPNVFFSASSPTTGAWQVKSWQI